MHNFGLHVGGVISSHNQILFWALFLCFIFLCTEFLSTTQKVYVGSPAYYKLVFVCINMVLSHVDDLGICSHAKIKQA